MVDLHQQVLDLVRAGQSWDQLYRNVSDRHPLIASEKPRRVREAGTLIKVVAGA
jgi:hypothetical protein